MKVRIRVLDDGRVIRVTQEPRMAFIIKMCSHLAPDVRGVINKISDLNEGKIITYPYKQYTVEATSIRPHSRGVKVVGGHTVIGV